MELDIPTLALVQSLVFITQAIILTIQYAVNPASQGVRFWVLGSVLMAVGIVSMPLVSVNSWKLLGILSVPLFILGLTMIYVGILRFLDRKENRFFLFGFYGIYLVSHAFFVFGINALSVRTVVVNVTLTVISFLIGFTLISRRRKGGVAGG